MLLCSRHHLLWQSIFGYGSPKPRLPLQRFLEQVVLPALPTFCNNEQAFLMRMAFHTDQT